MALAYYPRRGEILVCHYDMAAPPPEMIKTRPVVVFGPRLRRRPGLVTVVPLSTTPPTTVEPYHCRIVLAHPLPPPFDAPVMWAKCDMVSSVAITRIDRFRQARHGGVRGWITGQVDSPQFTALQHAVLCGLGLKS